MCYEEATVEMNIHVEDDGVGVEKSPENERPLRGVEKRDMVRLTMSFIFW